MKTQGSSLLDGLVGARLTTCAAVLGAAASGMPAHAAVVTFNTQLVVPDTFDGLYLNFLTGATGTSGSSVPGWDWNPYNSGSSLSFFWNASPSPAGGVAGTATGPYIDLPLSSTISAASTFAQVTAGTATAAFQTAGTHFLGFRFWNESTSAINYGYAMLLVSGTNGFPLMIFSWSFENTGAPMQSLGPITPPPPVVPEPSTAAMLSMGALLLGAQGLRRHRRLKVADGAESLRHSEGVQRGPMIWLEFM